jgi:hypothetical protein
MTMSTSLDLGWPPEETRVELTALGVTLVARPDPTGERWDAILDVLLGKTDSGPEGETPEAG